MPIPMQYHELCQGCKTSFCLSRRKTHEVHFGLRGSRDLTKWRQAIDNDRLRVVGLSSGSGSGSGSVHTPLVMSNLDHEIQLERVVSTRSEEVVEQDVIETTEPREEMVEESPLPEGKVVDPELELSNPRENGHAKEVLNDAASTRGGLRGSETQHNGGPGVMQMELDQTASIPQLSLLVRVSIGIATMLCYFVGVSNPPSLEFAVADSLG